MKVKVTLKRTAGPAIDLVVSADASAPIGVIAKALAEADPYAAKGAVRALARPTLAVLRGDSPASALPPEVEFGEAAVGSGDVVQLVNEGEAPAPGSSPSTLAVTVTAVDGPGAPTTLRIGLGSHHIGREQGNEIVLNDPLVSKRHARIDVTPNGVRLIDLNSANGVLLDGEPVTRLDVAGGESLVLGDTTITLEVSGGRSAGTRRPAGPIQFLRSPRVEGRYGGTDFPGPKVPEAVDSQPFPWLAMVAPLVMGAVMFSMTRNPTSIMFVALSPLLMAGNYISGKAARKKKFTLAVEKFDEQLADLDASLSKEIEVERGIRLGEHPSTSEVAASAAELGQLLWTRRSEHWTFLSLRLGLGSLESRNSVGLNGEESGLPAFLNRLREVADRHTLIADVPVPENIFESGSIGVAGDRAQAASTTRALLVQLMGLHSPAELVVAAIVGPATTSHFEWLKWMPHTSSPKSPLETHHLVNSATSATALVAAIEELVDQRLGGGSKDDGGRGATKGEASAVERGAAVGKEPAGVNPPSGPTPAVIVLIADDAPIDRARMLQVAERAADAGVYPLWMADRVENLPAVARTFVSVDASGSGEVGYVRQGRTIALSEVEQFSMDQARAFATSLAPVSDAGAHVEEIGDLPQSVHLLSLLGQEIAAAPERAVERWRQNDSIHDRSGAAPAKKSKRPGRLRAIVGHGVLDAMHLDLRTQGPHALVGGTTGSGKSEFLQAWVLGMAAEYSPDRVTFLFVDYKGGAAFADCVKLPHTVGLVTDLNTHLVRRALTSLRAELHHRERLLARKKAKDLIELERRGDPESPPALVIVIDEFAALVGEVPEFVDGVVDVAQRGRSLGIHLIMATQRPAGVIRDNLRANTNMRVALRMADESDSIDVVGEKIAAGFDPGTPGRAVAKTGPGRLTAFQSAYAGGWSSATPPAPSVDISELRFGAPVDWERPETEDAEQKDQGPTDQQRLVAALSKASASQKIPPPRKPWLDPLPPVFDLTKLRQRTDTEILLGVQDVPTQQLQEEVYFRPDSDGSLAIYGTGGSGKTVALRTLAVAAGITPRGGPVDVYGIDYANGGLSMLEALPHVGSIVPGEDPERVIRLLRTMREELDARGPKFAKASAGSIVDYRKETGKTETPRILLILDGFPAFRQEFESTAARATWYDTFQQIIAEGRGLGMHVALTADRAASVPSSISSGIQRRVVLRLADDSGYAMLDVPGDVVGAGSPAGRAVIDGLEAQVAIAGGAPGVKDQAVAIAEIGQAMTRAGRKKAPPIGILEEFYVLDALPSNVEGRPVVGISERDLNAVGFDPTGTLVLAGPPGSGRSIALEALATAIVRADPKAEMYYLGNARSSLAGAPIFKAAETSIEKVEALARKLEPLMDKDGGKKLVVVVEGIADFLGTPADEALVALIKATKRSTNLLIAEAETSSWSSSWPLLMEVKAGRNGVLLQPDSLDGETIFKTSLPRTARADFSPGRGYYIARGKFTRIQVPVVDATAVVS